MNYTLLHIKQAILSQQFHWCRVFDANKKCILFINETAYVGLTPEKLIQLITEFTQGVPGRYSFDFKKSSKHGKAGTMSFTNVNCFGEGLIIPISSHDEGETEEERKKRLADLRRQVRAEIEAESVIKRTKEDAALLQQQLAELQTVGGKLNAIFNIFFQGITPQGAGQLQGQQPTTHNMGRLADLHPQQPQQQQAQQPQQQQYTPPQPQQAQQPEVITIQGTYFNGQLTPNDFNRANLCLEKLLARMDVTTLEAFTNKIYNEPAVIQQLKMFI